jgi:hypothetical protein
MDITVLDTNLNAIKIIDCYESFIWTDRYNSYGDFELYTTITDDILDYLKQGYYLKYKDSEHVMIIETIQITSDIEDGDHIKITGRSLESILDRRIVWGLKTINTSLQSGIKTLINESIISPSNSDRKISNFIFEDSTDSTITSLKLEAQYTGDNLYDVITSLCEEQSLGFKITINNKKQFVFKLYNGTDRSYNQNEVSYVIFSPNFENIINSNYIESNTALKNVTLIGGEGEGSERRYASVGDYSGLERRELFTDARDISSDIGDNETLSEKEYISLLEQRGQEKLAENVDSVSFEGEVDTTQMFKYGEDFFVGDIIQIADDYGHEIKARISEIVSSEDNTGFSVYPTFTSIDEEGE